MAVAGNADPMLGYLTTVVPPASAIARARREADDISHAAASSGAPGAVGSDGAPKPGVETIERLAVKLGVDGRAGVRRMQERGFDIALPESAAAARLDSNQRTRATRSTLRFDEEPARRDASPRKPASAHGSGDA